MTRNGGSYRECVLPAACTSRITTGPEKLDPLQHEYDASSLSLIGSANNALPRAWRYRTVHLDTVIDWLAAGISPGLVRSLSRAGCRENAELHLLLSWLLRKVG
ncbi:MAG: hypothetical protein CM1200mP9_00570 [Gammaproteobacteria bacterium]|nr:MAG: hypothetical protein CM1200mP9_00570 [Gammaproteobacteria bacterium]